MKPWWVLAGLAAGFGLSALLNATGLHWLNLPVIGLLVAYCVVGTVVVVRRRNRRS